MDELIKTVIENPVLLVMNTAFFPAFAYIFAVLRLEKSINKLEETTNKMFKLLIMQNKTDYEVKEDNIKELFEEKG